LHPRLVRRRSGSPLATLGLGVAAIASLALATLSGLLLMIYYVPSVERAHASVQDLIALVPLGRFLRNLHRWSGHAAVLLGLLHLVRTLLWGAYRGPHRRVWLVGVGLLLVTLATSYSGYLLPWDQDAFWTVTVGTSLAGYLPLAGEWLQEVLLGGAAVGQPALTRFFVLHVALLPAVGLVLLAIHLFRLRRAGGLARPRAAAGEGEELVPASPGLISRELAVVLLTTAVLCALALLADVRLGPMPDTLRPDNPPKAPWFLVGVQEMVSYSALVGGVLVPGLFLLVLTLGPWLDGGAECDGAPLRARGARLALPASALLAGGAALLAVRWWGDPQSGSSAWLNPASIAVLVALAATTVALVRWRSRALAVQSLLCGLLAALLIFTAVGWFWRGPDWRLGYHPGPGRTPDHVVVAPRSGEAP